MEDYQAELAKLEKIANSKIPSAWKLPLTEDELALQIHQMTRWWQAQVDWRRWVWVGRQASALVWSSLTHRRHVQDIEKGVIRHEKRDSDSWRYYHQEWLRQEELIVQAERDALAFDKAISESYKRAVEWNNQLLEQESYLSCGKMVRKGHERGLLARSNMWHADRRQMEDQKRALEEEWNLLDIRFRAPHFGRVTSII